MSELSNSFHVRSSDVREGVELLRRAGVPGYVYPPENGWVPVVFPHGMGGSDERVVAANRGLSVHYDYAEDHGVQVDLYQGAKRVARLFASFESARSTFDHAAFVAFGVMSESSAREIDHWLGHERDPGLLVVAAALGLPRHHWFSFDYASRAPVTSPSERIEVAKDGTIVKNEDDNADEGALSADTIGPLFRVAERLIRDLRARDLLVLTVDADADVLAEALVDVLSGLDTARAEDAVLRFFSEHALVDEIFADEAEICDALRSASAR
jgi:hypothetical protein